MELVIIGARIDGSARVMLDIVRSMDCYRVTGFLDDNPDIQSVDGIPVLGPLSMLPKLDPQVLIALALSGGKLRKKLIIDAIAHGIYPINAIHKLAYVAMGVDIGVGNRFSVGSIVNPGCELGYGIVINTAASIDHDCLIADGVHVAPGARLCGRVHVGEYSLIGAGSVILPDMCIGKNSTVGAGAVVTHDVPDGVTVMGVPARARKESNGSSYQASISRYYNTSA